jgi:hypothetical protein
MTSEKFGVARGVLHSGVHEVLVKLTGEIAGLTVALRSIQLVEVAAVSMGCCRLS